MTKQILEQHDIQSTTSSSKYKVTKYDDGSWACSCPAWKFHKGTRVNCKHIQEVIGYTRLIIQEV